MPFTAIIPAYNEEKTIANVIIPLKQSGAFEEIIVVSDGSTDMTANVARQAGARVMVHEINKGKGAAMITGALQAKTDFIAFFDADLIDLTPDHVHSLTSPIANRRAQTVIALRDRGVFFTRIQRMLPKITGERVLHRSLFLEIPPQLLQGFRAEIAINHWIKKRRLKKAVVVFHGVKLRRKYQKVGIILGLRQYVSMTIQILRAYWDIWRYERASRHTG